MEWYILEIDNEIIVRSLPKNSNPISYFIISGPHYDQYEAIYEANLLRSEMQLEIDEH